MACERGRIEVARLLIEEGADAELLDYFGRSALSRVRDAAVRAELEQALRDYTTLRACAPLLK